MQYHTFEVLIVDVSGKSEITSARSLVMGISYSEKLWKNPVIKTDPSGMEDKELGIEVQVSKLGLPEEETDVAFLVRAISDKIEILESFRERLLLHIHQKLGFATASILKDTISESLTEWILPKIKAVENALRYHLQRTLLKEKGLAWAKTSVQGYYNTYYDGSYALVNSNIATVDFDGLLAIVQKANVLDYFLVNQLEELAAFRRRAIVFPVFTGQEFDRAEQLCKDLLEWVGQDTFSFSEVSPVVVPEKEIPLSQPSTMYTLEPDPYVEEEIVEEQEVLQELATEPEEEPLHAFEQQEIEQPYSAAHHQTQAVEEALLLEEAPKEEGTTEEPEEEDVLKEELVPEKEETVTEVKQAQEVEAPSLEVEKEEAKEEEVQTPEEAPIKEEKSIPSKKKSSSKSEILALVEALAPAEVAVPADQKKTSVEEADVVVEEPAQKETSEEVSLPQPDDEEDSFDLISEYVLLKELKAAQALQKDHYVDLKGFVIGTLGDKGYSLGPTYMVAKNMNEKGLVEIYETVDEHGLTVRAIRTN